MRNAIGDPKGQSPLALVLCIHGAVVLEQLVGFRVKLGVALRYYIIADELDNGISPPVSRTNDRLSSHSRNQEPNARPVVIRGSVNSD